MEIWPAIDLRGGRCVRLQQGDYGRETVFSDDPAQMARQWVEAGAEYLHLVDLDGARDGSQANRGAVEAILAAVTIPCELGGGIRDERVIAEWLQAGMARLAVGTKALRDPDWFRAMCQQFPGRLALGVDAREGWVATDGWLETSNISAIELVGQYADLPLAAVIYTDISKDGMLAGPNLSSTAEMQRSTRFPVIASGGVTTADDIQRLAETGVAGCIIGRALYEGSLTIADAMAAARSVGKTKEVR
jgi:phosphoribosylformimino-5-aminoimidazole carboxamide ribotide isomerase